MHLSQTKIIDKLYSKAKDSFAKNIDLSLYRIKILNAYRIRAVELTEDNKLKRTKGNRGFSKLVTLIVAIVVASVISKSEILISEFMNLFQ